MAGLQKKQTTNWAISAGSSLGGGKGKVGAGMIGLTLFDVDSQIYIPLTLYGASVGGGIPVGFNLSTFSPTFFTTTKPLWASDFNGGATVGGADLTIGVGGSLAYVTFWGTGHSPYWLDIGGLQVGVSAGISAGIYKASTYIEDATPNNGCIISPDGDSSCGGSSKKEPRSSSASTPAQSR